MLPIEPSFHIESEIDANKILKEIELCGRTAYKSEDKITDDSALGFVKMIVKAGHISVLDHHTIRVRFIVDRGVTHELVRHRIGVAFTQESTRYCNYSKGKFGCQITVIKPVFWSEEKDTKALALWVEAMTTAERIYFELLKIGSTPQQARSVLPHSLKTEIVVTADLTEWRHILGQRCSPAAHPQMREVMVPLLLEFRKRLPIIFDDIHPEIVGEG